MEEVPKPSSPCAGMARGRLGVTFQDRLQLQAAALNIPVLLHGLQRLRLGARQQPHSRKAQLLSFNRMSCEWRTHRRGPSNGEAGTTQQMG